jgi:nitrogen regulatory protein PII
MQSVKRIEIIADEQEMHKILNSLEKVGVPGYSVIHNVTGKTPRATAADDVPITGLGNVYVLCFCQAELADNVVEKIKPILNKFGGVCYISDAIEIPTIHCVASVSA